MKLGKGSFGVVKTYKEKYAIKSVPFENGCVSQDMWREWYVYRILPSHPHITRCYAVCVDTKARIIIEKAIGNINNLSFENEQYKKDCMFAIVNALAFLHSENLVYLDVKTSNVLDFGEGIYKLCDFGSTTFAGQICDQTLVSRWWRPPELLKGKTFIIKPSIDCWGVGVIMHDIWTGDYTFASNNEYELERKMKKFVNTINVIELQRMINSLMRIDPEERCSLKIIVNNEWWGREKRKYEVPVIDESEMYFDNVLTQRIYTYNNCKSIDIAKCIENQISYSDEIQLRNINEYYR